MATFGGEFRMNYNGVPLRMRGNFNITPSNIEVDDVVNQDNSVDRVMKPAGYTAEMNFADSGGGDSTQIDWNAIARGGPYRITVVEDVTRTVHTWTRAFFKGAPKSDRHNGEVSGLMVRADAYSSRKS